MTSTDIALTLISVLGTISAIVFGFFAFRRNQKNDDRKEAEGLASIKSDLSYIKDSVNKLVATTEVMKQDQSELTTRIAVVEEKVKKLEEEKI